VNAPKLVAAVHDAIARARLRNSPEALRSAEALSNHAGRQP